MNRLTVPEVLAVGPLLQPPHNRHAPRDGRQDPWDQDQERQPGLELGRQLPPVKDAMHCECACSPGWALDNAMPEAFFCDV